MNNFANIISIIIISTIIIIGKIFNEKLWL